MSGGVSQNRRRISVYLAGEFFESQKTILQRVSDIFYSYESGQELGGNDYSFCRDLIDNSFHAESIIGCGIKAIRVFQEEYPGRGRRFAKSFQVVRLDNSSTEFSFKAIAPSRMHDLHDFLNAAAAAVEQQLEMVSRKAFKSSTSQIWCSEEKTWICQQRHAVIYHQKDFESLAKEYAEAHKLNFSALRYSRCPERAGVLLFADAEDSRNWQDWHRRYAKLRVVKRGGCLHKAANAG